MPAPPESYPQVEDDFPWWSRSLCRERDGKFIAEARGWPRRAWSVRGRVNPDTSISTVGGVDIGSVAIGDAYVAYFLLPLTPLPSGLLVNALVYALILMGAGAVVRGLNRAYRMEHGRCPSCGYNLAPRCPSPCSECGWKHLPTK